MDDLFSVEGKTALVTGGTRGIGRMIAEGFVRAGVKVYVSSRKQADCDETASTLSEHGSCIGIPADLSREDECNRLGDEVAAHESALHILVNNAGANWGAPYEEFPASGWDRCLDLNLKGPFFLTRRLTPLLEKAARPRDPARVVNIGSIDGLTVPSLETYAYSASKAAIHHMTRVLARKLAPRGITVNAVAPGAFQSKMMAATLEQFGDQIAATNPLRRIGEPEDMAGVAIYLCSRAGAYLTGSVIPVDGGVSNLR